MPYSSAGERLLALAAVGNVEEFNKASPSETADLFAGDAFSVLKHR